MESKIQVDLQGEEKLGQIARKIPGQWHWHGVLRLGARLGSLITLHAHCVQTDSSFVAETSYNELSRNIRPEKATQKCRRMQIYFYQGVHIFIFSKLFCFANLKHFFLEFHSIVPIFFLTLFLFPSHLISNQSHPAWYPGTRQSQYKSR